MECMYVHFITDALRVFPDFDDIIAGLTINTCLSTFIHLQSDVDSFRPSWAAITDLFKQAFWEPHWGIKLAPFLVVQ